MASADYAKLILSVKEKFMELTREHFDEQMSKMVTKEHLEQRLQSLVRNLVTKDDAKQFATKEDLKNELKNVVTKDFLTAELGKQNKELKKYAEDQTEKLAQLIANDIVEPMERHFAKYKNHHRIHTSLTGEL
jgi:hypothetical protein